MLPQVLHKHWPLVQQVNTIYTRLPQQLHEDHWNVQSHMQCFYSLINIQPGWGLGCRNNTAEALAAHEQVQQLRDTQLGQQQHDMMGAQILPNRDALQLSLMQAAAPPPD